MRALREGESVYHACGCYEQGRGLKGVALRLGLHLAAAGEYDQ